MKPSIIFWGTPHFAADILSYLIDSNKYHIAAIVTQPDRPVGRHQIMTPSEVSLIGDKYQLKVLKPTKLDSEFIEQLKTFGEVDLFVVTAYGKIIPQSVLDLPKSGCINIHPSLLPKYRGASPIQTAILNGDTETGITIMLMDQKMDHGPILNTSTISLSNQDNSQILSNKISELSGPLLVETIDDYLIGNITPKPQDEHQATFCQTITKDDGYFDINNPPSSQLLDQMIRAYYPWPTAWTKWQGKIVKFYPEFKVQMEGKNIISWDEFQRGYPDFPKLLS